MGKILDYRKHFKTKRISLKVTFYYETLCAYINFYFILYAACLKSYLSPCIMNMYFHFLKISSFTFLINQERKYLVYKFIG